MRYKQFLKQLPKKDGVVFFNEPLSSHCSFKIGGTAKYFVAVHNTQTLLQLFSKTKKIFVLGLGTNTLFANKFFRGTIVKLGGNFLKTRCKNNTIIAGAGLSLFSLAKILREKELGVLEFAFGIPGTVGGAVFMNAGAFEHEIRNYVEKVKIFNGKSVFWTKNFNFSYRNSSFKQNKQIILAVKFRLEKLPSEKIFALQKEYMSRRRNSQPYGEASAGSVFKRIIKQGEILYPAKMIDNLGLKGVKIGDAKISEKHAGFIVNTNDAKFNDVYKLIKQIKRIVKKETGESLEEEIVFFRGKRNDYFRRLPHPHNLFQRKTQLKTCKGNNLRKRSCRKAKRA